jgi:carboxymethylenebutenolidase
MSDAMRAETVTISGANGDELEAYLAQPLDRTGVGGVVVIAGVLLTRRSG